MSDVDPSQEDYPEAPAPQPQVSASPTPVAEKTSINLLILITGSIAAIKTGLLLDQLANERCHIRLASTRTAFHFLHRAQPSKTGIPFKSILSDDQEWSEWQAMNDSVVHIELRRWADLVVVAPLDANSLAKIATGLCDNLVTCVMRAWQVGEKPVIICPAMNTAMWGHPITDQQIATLRGWYGKDTKAMEGTAPGAEGEQEPTETANDKTLPSTLDEAMFQLVGPVSKRLACGDVGLGGMASVEEIAQHVKCTMELLRQKKAKMEEATASA